MYNHDYTIRRDEKRAHRDELNDSGVSKPRQLKRGGIAVVVAYEDTPLVVAAATTSLATHAIEQPSS